MLIKPCKYPTALRKACVESLAHAIITPLPCSTCTTSDKTRVLRQWHILGLRSDSFHIPLLCPIGGFSHRNVSRHRATSRGVPLESCPMHLRRSDSFARRVPAVSITVASCFRYQRRNQTTRGLAMAVVQIARTNPVAIRLDKTHRRRKASLFREATKNKKHPQLSDFKSCFCMCLFDHFVRAPYQHHY